MDILLTLLMFVALVGLLMSGFPVAFTLGGVGLLFGLIGLASGQLDIGFLTLLPNRLYENILLNELLFAVPLFVAMGVILEKSRVAEDLLESMGQVFGPLRGGLGISVTIVGALLAASTGIVGATVVTMGLLSLPTMLARGYNPCLATGTIAASGTLGQIIPPSIVLILLADVLSNAWSEAQRAKGNFIPDPMSAGELFAGALIPGLLLVGLYIIWQIWVALRDPQASPAVARSADTPFDGQALLKLVIALIPPISLIIAVLGSILSGVATPTEAASVGAVGAVFLGAARQHRRYAHYAMAALVCLALLFALPSGTPGTDGDTEHSRYFMIFGPLAALILMSSAVQAYQRMKASRLQPSVTDIYLPIVAVGAIAPNGGAWGLVLVFAVCFAMTLWALVKDDLLKDAMQQTVRVSTMVYAILIGAALFSLVFRGLGGDAVIEDMLTGLPGGTWGALFFVMLLMFVLGFFLDFIEITFVVVPVVAPVLLAMDGIHGPIWLGVLMAMNLQTSFLTPPFGFALFYLRGVADQSVRTSDIYRGVVPYIIIQLLALALIIVIPDLVTWLPERVFG